jgi:hypothetical protein
MRLRYRSDSGSILVVFFLVGSLDVDPDVLGLMLLHKGQFGVEGTQVKSGDFLVQDLGELVHLVSVGSLILVLPDFELGQSLVGE